MPLRAQQAVTRQQAVTTACGLAQLRNTSSCTADCRQLLVVRTLAVEHQALQTKRATEEHPRDAQHYVQHASHACTPVLAQQHSQVPRRRCWPATQTGRKPTWPLSKTMMTHVLRAELDRFLQTEGPCCSTLQYPELQLRYPYRRGTAARPGNTLRTLHDTMW